MDFVAKAGALNILEMNFKSAVTVNYRWAFEKIKFFSYSVSSMKRGREMFSSPNIIKGKALRERERMGGQFPLDIFSFSYFSSTHLKIV